MNGAVLPPVLGLSTQKISKAVSGVKGRVGSGFDFAELPPVPQGQGTAGARGHQAEQTFSFPTARYARPLTSPMASCVTGFVPPPPLPSTSEGAFNPLPSSTTQSGQRAPGQHDMRVLPFPPCVQPKHTDHGAPQDGRASHSPVTVALPPRLPGPQAKAQTLPCSGLGSEPSSGSCVHLHRTVGEPRLPLLVPLSVG